MPRDLPELLLFCNTGHPTVGVVGQVGDPEHAIPQLFHLLTTTTIIPHQITAARARARGGESWGRR
jgi:hypothetical protein